MNIPGDRCSDAHPGADSAWLVFLIYGLGAGWREISSALRTLLAAAAWWLTRCSNTSVGMARGGLVCDFGAELPSRSASTESRARAGRVCTVANDTKSVAGLGEFANLRLKRWRRVGRRRVGDIGVVQVAIFFARADFRSRQWNQMRLGRLQCARVWMRLIQQRLCERVGELP